MKKRKIKTADILRACLLPLIAIAVWQGGIMTGILPRSIIAPPLPAFQRFFELLYNGVFLEHFLISIKRLFGGFIAGSALGITLGVGVAYSRLASRYLEPFLLWVIPVPPLAWISLLVVLFGTGDLVKMALIACGCFATMFLSTSIGTRGLDKRYLELAAVYGKSDSAVVFRIILPFLTPIIFSSLRVAMALSWTLLMASEMIKSSSGLGWFISDARNFSRSVDLMAGILIVGLLGKLTDLLVVKAGNYCTKWQDKIDG